MAATPGDSPSRVPADSPLQQPSSAIAPSPASPSGTAPPPPSRPPPSPSPSPSLDPLPPATSALPQDLFLRILRFLPPNEIATTARLTCTAAARHFSRDHHRTVRLTTHHHPHRHPHKHPHPQALPAHACHLWRRYGAESLALLSFRHKLILLSHAAATGSRAFLSAAWHLVKTSTFPQLPPSFYGSLYYGSPGGGPDGSGEDDVGQRHLPDPGTAAAAGGHACVLLPWMVARGVPVHPGRALVAAARYEDMAGLKTAWRLMWGGVGDAGDGRAAAKAGEAVAYTELDMQQQQQQQGQQMEQQQKQQQQQELQTQQRWGRMVVNAAAKSRTPDARAKLQWVLQQLSLPASHSHSNTSSSGAAGATGQGTACFNSPSCTHLGAQHRSQHDACSEKTPSLSSPTATGRGAGSCGDEAVCTWLSYETAAAAAKSGDLPRLQWLHACGCHVSHWRVLAAALRYGPLAMAEWLVDEAGCPLPVPPPPPPPPPLLMPLALGVGGRGYWAGDGVGAAENGAGRDKAGAGGDVGDVDGGEGEGGEDGAGHDGGGEMDERELAWSTVTYKAAAARCNSSNGGGDAQGVDGGGGGAVAKLLWLQARGVRPHPHALLEAAEQGDIPLMAFLQGDPWVVSGQGSDPRVSPGQSSEPWVGRGQGSGPGVGCGLHGDPRVGPGLPLTGEVLCYAALSGRLDAAAWLLREGCPVDGFAVGMAAERGDGAMVEWLVREAGCPVGASTVEALVEVWPELRGGMGKGVVVERVATGKEETGWEGRSSCWGPGDRELLRLVQMMREKCGVKLCRTDVLRLAVRRGDVGLVRYLHQGAGCGMGTGVLVEAAKGGCGALVGWLLGGVGKGVRGGGGAVAGEEAGEAYAAAAANGDLATVRLLQQLGVGWGSGGVRGAVRARCGGAMVAWIDELLR